MENKDVSIYLFISERKLCDSIENNNFENLGLSKDKILI